MEYIILWQCCVVIFCLVAGYLWGAKDAASEVSEIYEEDIRRKARDDTHRKEKEITEEIINYCNNYRADVNNHLDIRIRKWDRDLKRELSRRKGRDKTLQNAAC